MSDVETKTETCQTCKKTTVQIYSIYSSLQCYDCIIEEENFDFITLKDVTDDQKQVGPRKPTWAECLCWGKRKNKPPLVIPVEFTK